MRGLRPALDASDPHAQGMVTNDMRLLERPGERLGGSPMLPLPSVAVSSHTGSPPLYAAILSPKGKLLHDLFLYRENGTGEVQGEAGGFLQEINEGGRYAERGREGSEMRRSVKPCIIIVLPSTNDRGPRHNPVGRRFRRETKHPGHAGEVRASRRCSTRPVH